MEIWKDIEGYDGKYQVSNLGNVKSCGRTLNGINGSTKYKKESFLTANTDPTGYLSVMVCVDYKFKRLAVHRLVAQAFVPNLENKKYVNHIDGNKLNNNSENLEWVTAKENTQHALKLNLILTGENCNKSILKSEDVLKIRKLHELKVKRKEITKMFPQVSPTTIRDVIFNKTWKQLIKY